MANENEPKTKSSTKQKTPKPARVDFFGSKFRIGNFIGYTDKRGKYNEGRITRVNRHTVLIDRLSLKEKDVTLLNTLQEHYDVAVANIHLEHERMFLKNCCEYLHELQNAFYVFAGRELTDAELHHEPN